MSLSAERPAANIDSGLVHALHFLFFLFSLFFIFIFIFIFLLLLFLLPLLFSFCFFKSFPLSIDYTLGCFHLFQRSVLI